MNVHVLEPLRLLLHHIDLLQRVLHPAVDVHGNSQRITKRDSGLYARLAEWVPKLPGTLRLIKQAFPVSLTPLEVVGLLAGFSFAVGQSVNDIITLLRNPDQLLAFVDLAKAVYDRPEISRAGDLVRGRSVGREVADERDVPTREPAQFGTHFAHPNSFQQ